MGNTKTVYHPVTHEPIKLVECNMCGGTGKYWREEIGQYWPCHTCEGYGCRTLTHSQRYVPHPHAQDLPYKPTKGIA